MDFLLQRIVPSIIGTAASLAGAYLLILWNHRRHGGWSVILLNGAQQLGCARLGWRTAKEWLADDWQRKLGLKSMCADHGCRLTRNVLEISTIDAKKRRFLIHFEQNSPATKEAQ